MLDTSSSPRPRFRDSGTWAVSAAARREPVGPGIALSQCAAVQRVVCCSTKRSAWPVFKTELTAIWALLATELKMRI